MRNLLMWSSARQQLQELQLTCALATQLTEITAALMPLLQDRTGYRRVVMLLKDDAGEEYIPHAAEGESEFTVRLSADHPLISLIQAAPHPVLRQKLKNQAAAGAALEWFNSDAALPLFVREQLCGLVLLGRREQKGAPARSRLQFAQQAAAIAAPHLERTRRSNKASADMLQLQADLEAAQTAAVRAAAQLYHVNKTKSEFVSIASHQLYTPLTALRGYVSMLREGEFGSIAKQQQPILQMLEQSAERLIELIKELLDISRIESGRLELNLESIDLGEMAEILVKDLLPNAMRKDLDLEFERPRQPLPQCVGDAQRLRQVMLNFVDNAIKYTEKGAINVTLRRDGDEVVFAVTDTGVGLSAADIERLFTKFTRVGGAQRFHTEGTGLGLYVARQIVQEHHGSVQVTSPGKGKGSTFEMRLPAEGTPKSHKVGEKATIAIKAAEANTTRHRERVKVPVI